MRVSSGMIFDAGIAGINRQTASLLKVQQQIASGRRILTPSDDPVAAARALEVTQASDIVAQFKENQNYAVSALGIEEVQLAAATDVIGRVHELAVQGSNSTLTDSARAGIATELRARFDELLGIANSGDGTGNYLFAGFMSSTTPFAGTVDGILAGSDVVYQGDDGQRKLQVSPTRVIEVSDAGSDLFRRIASGNGYFATDYAAGNSGTGVINSGAVSNPAAWNSSASQQVAINFTVSGGVTSYDLVDTVSGNSLLTGTAAPAAPAAQRVFQAGQPIVLSAQGAEAAFDLGASVTITGTAADGDSFTLAPGGSQSVFTTVARLIGALEAPAATPAAKAQLASEVGFAVTNLSHAANRISETRSLVGSRMNELESLGSLNEDLDLQYQQTLSTLQDVDYAKAVSDLTRKQFELEAAQQSFFKISQLSLFNFL